MPLTTRRAVRDLGGRCTYVLRAIARPTGLACGREATSAVQDGSRYRWRCEDHVGQIDAARVGVTVVEVEV